ncbi:phosphocholine-specific phospholipase C [Kitasatospora cineracea]|uniref:phospholipase C n=1 Tax=Kitasatospora cineracea TaxID=88074 RepID=A0A8G1XDF5_9ACTN|nr:phospholipase C, phosphocholine-specific [Kitasatospora cineracea]ROR46415.1 phospholipase C [Kitasatospora cineracea]
MSDEQRRPLSRRSFLGAAGAAASVAGLAAAGSLSQAVRELAAVPVAAGSGSLADVKHVVIFMQENRAFDHYFGTLNGVRGFGDRNAITLPGGKPVWQQPNSSNPDGYIAPFRMNTATTSSICAGAAAMDWSTDLGIYNGGKFDSWNSARNPAIGMGHFARKDLDFYYELANAFTICDHYFQSTLTQTNPNRLHVFTGSNGGSVGQSAIMDNSEPSAGFTWTTYAERLQNAGISWKVYQQSDNFDDNALAWFANFKNAKAGQPLYDRGLATVPDLVAAFGNDLANGTLPQVSWIVAPAFQSEHANYRPAVGADLTARLLKQLAAHPDVWANTAFLLNYDENGGFFDHVVPPMPPTSDSDGLSTVTTSGEISGGKQMGLGFRVPMIVISPWTRGGYVCSQVFDHTSVLRFCESVFGVAETNISPWRKAVTGDLTSAFDFTSAATAWPSLPDTSHYVGDAETQCSTLPSPTIPTVQQLPVQEAGHRRARPIPYAFEAKGRVTAGTFYIDMANTGAAGQCVYICPNDYRTDGPWRHTVEAGKTLTDYFVGGTPTGAYDLSMYGPNGFHRRFKGNRVTATTSGNANPEVTAAVDGPGGTLTLTMKNNGSAACTVTLTSNAYRTDGPWTFNLAAGATTTKSLDITGSSHWYDLTATANTADGFLRRFAGHAETGRESITDPAVIGMLPVSAVSADSWETNSDTCPPANVLDDNPTSMWHTRWNPTTDPFPHDIRFDLGTARTATGLTYLPRFDGGNGRIGRYEIATSSDGTTWSSPVASGTWADDAKAKAVTFPPVTARWVRLRALTEAGNRGTWTSAAEIRVLGPST